MLRTRLSSTTLINWCSRHPLATVGMWLALCLISGLVIISLLSDAMTTQISFTSDVDSQKAQDLLEDRLTGPKKDVEWVIVRSDNFTVDDQTFQDYTQAVYQDIIALGPGIVISGINYYETGSQALVSADKHTTIMPIVMAGDMDDASDHIGKVLNVVENANGQSGFQVFTTGQASIGNDFSEVAEKDLRRAEIIGVVIALVILVLVFGALVAAVIPLILGGVAIIVALLITALVGQVFQLYFIVVNMVSMMGLAVGIDYSLLVVSRYREERRLGREKLAAISVAGVTANRTVLFSGLMVVVALCGMLIMPLTVFRSLSLGAIFVVLAAVLASQTLLPAILSLLGDKINSLHLPYLHRKQKAHKPDEDGGFWIWVSHAVMKRPVVSLVLSIGALLLAASPLLGIKTGAAGVSTLPGSIQSRKGFEILNRDFSAGLISPTDIVIDGEINSSPVQDGIQKLTNILANDQVFGQPDLQVNTQGNLADLSVPVRGDSTGDEAVSAIRRLRDKYIPEAFTGTQAKVYVGGETAANVDYFDVTDRFTPVVFAFVLGLSFIFLIVVFRSLVVPIKAIIMNLLSVGAAYGLLVLVFQKGVGADLLNFQKVEVLEAWIPLFLFCILFGLSMDYHVFLLSRIRERFDSTHDNTEAVAFGLRSTGAIITGAALIMVTVFGSFGTGKLVIFQQLGFGLTAAVLMDAVIVRIIVVPSAMRLLGIINWYFPSMLRWIPDVRVDVGELDTKPKAGSRLSTLQSKDSEDKKKSD